jgi:hypothetical protein
MQSATPEVFRQGLFQQNDPNPLKIKELEE